MDQESWPGCEKLAVLHGGFLLANQLCLPESLSSLRKEDWDQIGSVVVHTVQDTLLGSKDKRQCKKAILCIIWSKLLEQRNGEDINIRWRTNPLFAVLNGLPDINHTLMFELMKSMGFAVIYVELLLCFELTKRCEELEMLVDHVTRNSTEADVKLLLEVWWELLKEKRGSSDRSEHLFTAQCSRSITSTEETSPLASKRFKPDPESSSTCMVHILFEALRKMKECFASSELCCFALSNSLDTLYTHYLLTSIADLPIKTKLQHASRAVSLRGKDCEMRDVIDVICESQRDLSATLTPAETKPCGISFLQAMQVVLEVSCSWEVMGLLKMTTVDPNAGAIRLQDSLNRVLASLENLSHAKDVIGNGQTLNTFRITLQGLLATFTITVPECPATDIAKISMDIIDHNLKGFGGLFELFASRLSQDCVEDEWIKCLERNKNLFQTKDLVMALVSTLIAKCQTDTPDQHCRKLKDLIVDMFSQLTLLDQNATLSDTISMSEKGLHGFLPKLVTAGFSEELNLAFNSIIQSGAQKSLDAAVSSVARVAFQNPVATLCRCCHMAVVSLGAHSLIAEILQQLPGLVCSPKGHNLLARCLLDSAWSKMSSAQEENQFLQFLTRLMKCDDSEKPSCLPPAEALRVFVQPYLFSTPNMCNLDLCLRLLQATLNQEPNEGSTHWVMSGSPFPLLYCLAQLLNKCSRCWDQPEEDKQHLSMESKELLLSVVNKLGSVVGHEVVLSPDVWSRALFWLYNKVEKLDWTVRIVLKDVWGQHFKYEVPSSLLAVCELSEHEWSSLELPQYGQGTGLLAWLECCMLSDTVCEAMLESLNLSLLKPDDVNMFSKGLLVAVSQVLPWCTPGEWERVVRVLKRLLQSSKLYVPYSLEYVDFLPLLDMRSFADDLRLSVFLLRIFQLLCGSSCSDWLPPQGWRHTGRLYANAVRGIISPLSQTTTLTPSSSACYKDPGAYSQEVLFVLTQLFCHVLHVQVMIPGQPEALFLCALEILSNYESVHSAHPDSCTALQGLNTRHFLTTIANNLESGDMKAALHQKIAQL